MHARTDTSVEFDYSIKAHDKKEEQNSFGNLSATMLIFGAQNLINGKISMSEFVFPIYLLSLLGL